jgi:hypothetical protein
MTKRANDSPPDPAQMSLGGIVASLPAVKTAKKANTLSRVHRRLIEPIESDQDNEARLSFQHTVFCQAGLPYRNPGDGMRVWERRQGTILLRVHAGEVANPTTQNMVESACRGEPSRA